MGRPLFYLDRFDGRKWVTLYAAPHQIGPQDLRGPEGSYPEAAGAENATAFTGKSGGKARIRVDEIVVEEFDWALIPVNPLDPESDRKWGWKSLGRHYEDATGKLKELSAALSFLG